jgi:protein SCO1
MYQSLFGLMTRRDDPSAEWTRLWPRVRPPLRLVRLAWSVCFLLIFAGPLPAQQSFGGTSKQPPSEERYIYGQVPDIQIQTEGASPIHLSAIWQVKPVLLTMVFTRCAGVCSPFLHSLKSAVSEAGGLGTDFRVLVLSFDPKDTVADMDMMADSLGVKSNRNWIFGIALPSDIRRVAAATGFWFQWDQPTQQYDHPAVVVTIDRGKVVRMLVGATVPQASLSEVVQELRGKFVASYALPGKVAFRCFEYDPASGRYSLNWGVLLMILPGTLAAIATGCVFFSGGRPQHYTTVSPEGFALSHLPRDISACDFRAIMTAREEVPLRSGMGVAGPGPVSKIPEER